MNIYLILVLALMLGYLCLGKRKPRKITVRLGGSFEDIIQQLKDANIPITREEACDVIRHDSKLILVNMLSQALTSPMDKFVLELTESGFWVNRTHIRSDMRKYDAEFWIDMRMNPFVVRHNGIEYLDSTEEGIKDTNKTFVISKLNEFFGEAAFEGVGLPDREDSNIYTIKYNITELGGRLRRMLGEDFFEKYENLAKIHFEACKEGCVKTDSVK